jgi:nicotinamidase-related amidase
MAAASGLASLQNKDHKLFGEFLECLKTANADELFGEPDVSGAIVETKKIGAGDALIVNACQNDFLPADNRAEGGRFECPEGNLILPLIGQLITEAAASGAQIIACKDYHPMNHCSFMPEGHCPPHCVQGTTGCKFAPAIAKVLTETMKAHNPEGADNGDGPVSVAFKGMHPNVDSVGVLPYIEGTSSLVGMLYPTGIAATAADGDGFTEKPAKPWTGGIILKSSGMCFDGQTDPDAPPDAMATSSGAPDGGKDVVEKLKDCTRLVICGMALNMGVLHTALQAKANGFERVVIALDACRAVHLGGIGVYGSGFMHDPAELIGKCKEHGIRLESAVKLMTKFNPIPRASIVTKVPATPSPAFQEGGAFPSSLGPFGVDPADRLVIALEEGSNPKEECQFTINFKGQLLLTMKKLKGQGFDKSHCTPFCPITLPPEARKQAKIPEEAKDFAFAYACEGVNKMEAKDRVAFLSARNDPNWRFLLYGGFLYRNGSGTIIAQNSLNLDDTDLKFGPPQKWKKEYTKDLADANRFRPITLQPLRSAGARWFCWIHAGEELPPAGTSPAWVPAANGAFVYIFHDILKKVMFDESEKHCFFPVVA